MDKKNKKNNVKISIIIPVYNVEQYLDRCMQSVVVQTYKNLEIILVDDGSSDNCPKICDNWAKKDQRVKVIHKKNGGVSVARNAGIDVATGEYIGFVDADDYIDDKMFEKLYKKISKHDADIVMCGINYVDENKIYKLEELNLKKAEDESIYKYIILSGKKIKKDKIYTENIMCTVWRCLYKREFIKDIRFEKDMFCEDVVFTLYVLKKRPKICVIEDELYYYYQRNGSLLHYYNEKKMYERKDFIKHSIELLKEVLTKEQLAYHKFLQYELCFNEVALSKDKNLKAKFFKDKFLQGLNTKENYLAKKNNTKLFKYKIADFLTRHKWFWLFSKLVRFAK